MKDHKQVSSVAPKSPLLVGLMTLAFTACCDEEVTSIPSGTYVVESFQCDPAQEQGCPEDEEIAALEAVALTVDRENRQVQFDFQDGSTQTVSWQPLPEFEYPCNDGGGDGGMFCGGCMHIAEAVQLDQVPLALETMVFQQPRLLASFSYAQPDEVRIVDAAASKSLTFKQIP